jgi:hypothetical protein
MTKKQLNSIQARRYIKLCPRSASAVLKKITGWETVRYIAQHARKERPSQYVACYKTSQVL